MLRADVKIKQSETTSTTARLPTSKSKSHQSYHELRGFQCLLLWLATQRSLTDTPAHHIYMFVDQHALPQKNASNIYYLFYSTWKKASSILLNQRS